MFTVSTLDLLFNHVAGSVCSTLSLSTEKKISAATMTYDLGLDEVTMANVWV